MEQRPNLVLTAFKLPPSHLQQVDALAQEQGVTRSHLIREAVSALLEKRSA